MAVLGRKRGRFSVRGFHLSDVVFDPIGNWIYANASFGIQFYPDCDGVDFSYNVLDGNGALGYNSSLRSTTNGRGLTITISRSGVIHGQNPLYVDRTNHDYRLQAASPARSVMGLYSEAVPGPRVGK
jgi:hypothetical protein